MTAAQCFHFDACLKSLHLHIHPSLMHTCIWTPRRSNKATCTNGGLCSCNKVLSARKVTPKKKTPGKNKTSTKKE
jgi:hypothetical protein